MVFVKPRNLERKEAESCQQNHTLVKFLPSLPNKYTGEDIDGKNLHVRAENREMCFGVPLVHSRGSLDKSGKKQKFSIKYLLELSSKHLLNRCNYELCLTLHWLYCIAPCLMVYWPNSIMLKRPKLKKYCIAIGGRLKLT